MDQTATTDDFVGGLNRDLNRLVGGSDVLASLLVLIGCIIAAYALSRIVTRLLIFTVQFIVTRASRITRAEKHIKRRRIETYLSVTTAIMKVVIIIVVASGGWAVLNPGTSPRIAAIGAGTVFAILAGATISPLLRDLTAGATMIAGRWFNVGDYISLDGSNDSGGIVEQLTLRSTKIRRLNGEILWIHNQNISSVRVTPNGVRTVTVDVFVKDLERGRELVKRVSETIPTGTTAIHGGVKVVKEEQWAEKRWVISVQGKMPPGREWLLEDYFVESLKELDEGSKNPVMARIPLVRLSDPAAEKSFNRAFAAK